MNSLKKNQSHLKTFKRRIVLKIPFENNHSTDRNLLASQLFNDEKVPRLDPTAHRELRRLAGSQLSRHRDDGEQDERQTEAAPTRFL